MKVAVLGVGTIVPDFLEAAEKIDELEIYALFGRVSSISKMKALQEEYKIPKIYYDFEELLADENIDVIYVALPNHLHFSYAKKALQHKKHVIVEKPFASTYAQAMVLFDTARKQEVMIFEAISNQYMPNYKKTQELVKKIGDVKIVQLNYSQYSSRYDLFKKGIVHPVFDPEKSGGALMDINVYNIHYIVGLFGTPDRIRYSANIERGVDTSGILVLEYQGFQCVCIGAKDCKAPVSISVQGDKGYIHSNDASNRYENFYFSYNHGEPERFALNDGMPRLYYELRTFVDMVISEDWDELARFNRHTLDVMEILDGARQQVNIGYVHH